MTTPHILIIGAGLGGLSAAIALAQRGFSVEIFERAPVLAEVGAGLTVSRSVQQVFADFAMLDAVLAQASMTPTMAFVHYRTGRLLAGGVDHSDGQWSPDAPGAGLHIHRADLHAMLAKRFAAIAPGRLHLGKALTGFTDTESGVTAQFADGSMAAGDLLVGADGIRSAVRAILHGDDAPRFTGQTAYRFMMDGKAAEPFMRTFGRAALFQGPGKVFNRYTLRGGAIVNCVGIVQSEVWSGEGWFHRADLSEMLAHYDGWHDDVTGIMKAAPAGQIVKWGLFDRPPLPQWGRGNVILLGDAAHPMLPFLGLGAAMAIEDGMVLARALAAWPDRTGLARFEACRKPRCMRIADLSRVQGALAQQSDPDSYDRSSAPSHDKTIHDYDPVTVSLEEQSA
ncbi:FAD-dependent monooxygenase [Blastomonas fulva]|uniref:FAD-dependent monooxygenase n=1 Tax=Blastomonas fulva TaxID=1550728 RepID=UPI003F70BE99